MNFVDRLSLECIMNKSMYSKYLAAQKQTQEELFGKHKKMYKSEILEIVQRLLSDDDEPEQENENENKDDETNREIIIYPRVINLFDDFVKHCIENIQECKHQDNKSQASESEAIFYEDEDDHKYKSGSESDSETDSDSK
jgi:hypothetical protein